jgi:hypothetical protein
MAIAIRANNRLSALPQMPFAAEAQEMDDVLLNYRGEAARKQAAEAINALHRISDRIWSAFLINASITPFLLDPVNSQGELRAFAQSRGIDLDALASRAGKHFVGPQITRRVTPLTAEELKFLIDDDQRAFDR